MKMSFTLMVINTFPRMVLHLPWVPEAFPVPPADPNTTQARKTNLWYPGHFDQDSKGKRQLRNDVFLEGFSKKENFTRTLVNFGRFFKFHDFSILSIAAK